MAVKEVGYERLFSFGQYENEKIRMSAEVEPGQNADQVLAGLVLKIAAVEDVLQAYRSQVDAREYLAQRIHEKERQIADSENHIASMKVKIDEITARFEKGELDVDDKLRHACDRESYKSLKERLLAEQKELTDLEERHKKTINDVDLLKQRILKGDFNLEGIEVQVPRRYRPDY